MDDNERIERVLLSAAEVGVLLGMTQGWVYRETRAGRIPHIKLGRYYRYRRESIEEWWCSLEIEER